MPTRGIRTERAPAPVQGAPYQQGVAATPGEVLWVSGQVPLDPATGALAADVDFGRGPAPTLGIPWGDVSTAWTSTRRVCARWRKPPADAILT